MNDLRNWAILNLLDSEMMAQVRIALVFGNLGNRAIVVTNDDKVYTFGNNEGSCLGIALDVSPLFVPIEVESLSGKGVIKFASRNNELLALTKSGEVYCCKRTIYTTIIDLLDEKVIDIVCGEHYSLALTDQREVYAWGEMEDDDKKLIKKPPKKLSTHFEDDTIISITSEMNSILALTKTGLVYQWNSSIDSLNQMPQPVEILIDIVQITSGYNHSMALSKEGSVYIWGSNTYGQFGNGNQIGDMKPYKVLSQLVGHIVDIGAGENISAAVNKRGQVYMWGLCCSQKILIPTSVLLSNIDDVILYFSSNIVMRESREFPQKRDTTLLECMKQNLNNPKNSDLIINIQDKTIHVHKSILSLRSAHFERMFNGNWKEKTQSIIIQNQYPYDVYKVFLQYLYTGIVEASPEQVLELKKLANQYLDIELEEICNKILQNNKEESTSSVYELKKWPILNLLELELMVQVRMAMVFGHSGNEAIIITDDDKVYGVGTNEQGCLGIGIRSSILNATEIEVLSGKEVIKLAVSNVMNGIYVLALTKAGQVYFWGCTSSGELDKESLHQQWDPIQIKDQLSGKEVVDIACGTSISLALTKDGEVYQWRFKSNETSTLCPKRRCSEYFNSEKIVFVVCMASLNIVVSESNGIYCWDSKQRQRPLFIRHDDTSEIDKSEKFRTPKKFAGLGQPGIVKVVAGSEHLLILSKEGSLNILGTNEHGEVGCGSIFDDFTWYQMPMHMMGPIVDIAAGLHLSAAINKRGEVFMWGQCRGEKILIPIRTELSKPSDVILYFSTPSGMYQLELPKEEKINVLESIERGFNDPTNSDLVIKVQDKPIHLHKVILQIRSSYCEKLFREDWAGQNPIIIEDQHSYEVYISFFNYLYTDKVDVAPDCLYELLDLALQYSVPSLINRCNQLIDKNSRHKQRYFLSYSHLI